MGGYGMIRIGFPMVPEAMVYFATALAVFGVINIVYGAFVALAQTDLKRLVAYSSVSHMGYVILGLSTLGVAQANGQSQQAALMGATLQMFNHGTISAMLFLMVGVIYERAHHRDLNRFGGLLWSMPKYGVISSIALFATLALPGFSSFIGEALTLLGAYKFHPILTLVSTLGILLTAAYVLWTIQRMFLGKAKEEHSFSDLTGTEAFMLIPLAVITIFLGVYPKPMMDLIDTPLTSLIEVIKPAADALKTAAGG
jgi:NADH-quinone oxidoreductase subunit M